MNPIFQDLQSHNLQDPFYLCLFYHVKTVRKEIEKEATMR